MNKERDDMNKDINHNDIEDRALDVLTANGIDHPVVDVFKIAAGNGIKIKEINISEKYNGVAGFYSKDEKIIYVDRSDTPGRKLFTIAHELGHVFLGHSNYGVRFRTPIVQDEDHQYPTEERAANSFAASLLMPEFLVREYMEKYNFDRSDHVKMAKIFGVPYITMQNRLTNLSR